MPNPSVAIRLGIQGGDDAKRELREFASAGEGAFRAVGEAAVGATGKTEAQAAAMRRVIEQAEAMARAPRSAAASGAGSSAGGTPGVSFTARDNAALERHLKLVDETYARETKLNAARGIFDKALAANRITVEQHAKAIGLAAEKYEAAGKSGQLAAFQVQNIRAQLLDIGTSLQGGMNPLTVAMQQLPQIASAFGPGSGLGAMLRGTVSAIPRPLLYGAGPLALGATFATAANQAQREGIEERAVFRGTGRGSGLNRDELERIVSSSTGFRSGSNLSEAEGRSVGLILSGGRLGTAAVVRGLTEAKNMSLAFGMSVEDTAKMLAGFGDNAVATYDRITKATGYTNVATRERVAALANEGKGEQALIVTLDAVSDRLGTYRENTTLVDRALTNLGNVGSDAWKILMSDVDRAIDASGKHAEAVKSGTDKVVADLKREAVALEERNARYRERSDQLLIGLGVENAVARFNPLEQLIVQAQRAAGGGPALTEQERAARGGEAKSTRDIREGNDERIRQAFVERNVIDISKALTEQTRASTLTLTAETLAIGKSADQQARLTFIAQARVAAGQGGKHISEETIAQINREADAYARLIDNLQRTRLQDQIRFDRAQLGRDGTDAQIASLLRPFGGIDDPKNSAYAETLRMNAALGETKSLLSGAASGFLIDLRQGVTASQALANQAGRIADSLLTKAADKGVSALFDVGMKAVGLDKVGLPALTTATATMSVTAGVVNVTGGLSTDVLSGAAGVRVNLPNASDTAPTETAIPAASLKEGLETLATKMRGAGDDIADAGRATANSIGSMLPGTYRAIKNFVTGGSDLSGPGFVDAVFGDGAGVWLGAAGGGHIRGPGTSTSDSIPAMLSNGEFVLRAAAVDRVGVDYLDRLNRGHLPGYAAGGFVGAAPMATSSTAGSGVMTYAPVINMTPAQGVTPEQLASVLKQHGQEMMRQMPKVANAVIRDHGRSW